VIECEFVPLQTACSALHASLNAAVGLCLFDCPRLSHLDFVTASVGCVCSYHRIVIS
jgi:hypothetical protein